ncbi:hypothetical protein ANCCEY_09085 [Ancylostoma ceylanicum]|uniref:TIL domain-containing protein n=1 Tax=Ancylostoma ceylanicum TaxID=53326 RepID=A0A0D6LW31_9BILA|nr:hypothetical protein ANCCEY_09085 [Ancylostoma ceylanicum]
MVRSPASVIFVAILVYSEAAGVPARVQTPHVQNGAANSMSRAAKLQCSENEVLDECSTVCERTCDDPSTENCKFFPPNGKCYPRCLCKEGYYRSYYHNNSITGVCVPAEVCMTGAVGSQMKNISSAAKDANLHADILMRTTARTYRLAPQDVSAKKVFTAILMDFAQTIA